jgi:phospholipid/cholesterol/gamma-HCH transport system ATP-binding protein
MVMPATSSSADPIIQTRGLHVRFGAQVVLRDINLSIPRGETVTVIGESGCGKSVLLKSLIGLIRPSQGEVFFDGRDLAKLSEREVTQQRTRYGFLFQNAALFDSLTIGQNVAFPVRQHRRLPQRDVQNLVLNGLAEVGLPDTVVSKKPAELSGGMRKRVGLARALILNPELMLYDEPTTGLDPIMSDVINELMMRTRMRTRNGSPVTSIVVTHDMRTARKVADRVVMIFPLSRLEPDEPQIIFDGPPSQLDRCEDRRVLQFIRGEARDRLMEMRESSRLPA